jgi:superfamily II DNA or RNA helicase
VVKQNEFTIDFDLGNVQSYRDFIRAKSLPTCRFVGSTAYIPSEYSEQFNGRVLSQADSQYRPNQFLFDYQRDIADIAIKKRKYAIFADCGLGKTLIFLEYIRHVANELPRGKSILMVCPLMVVRQTINESKRWYGDALPIEQIASKDLPAWTNSGGRIGITNFEAITENVSQGRIGALVIDESSMLKSHYGAWGTRLIELGRGLEWKLAGTGTPAPNDRIEYANHAVLLDQFPTVNSFLAKYFVNRGETQNRWELKPHALRPFYKSLSHWSIFLTNPAVYGWKDNCGTLPPINVHIEDVALTDDQRDQSQRASGDLFGTLGGIGSRAKIARIAKGIGAESLKPDYIVNRVKSFGNEHQIIWCRYNAEQDALAQLIPDAGNIDGSTPHDERLRIVEDFQSGRLTKIITKPKILGLGMNLQCCSRQLFSTLQDSYEEYYQAVKRSNRYGSTRPLNVHIPVTDLERPMIETVLRKAARVQQDTEEQERLFREIGGGIGS